MLWLVCLANKHINKRVVEQIFSCGLNLQLFVIKLLKNSVIFALNLFAMDSRISSVESYIRKNLHQPMKITELAEVACMSPKHFQRAFKKSFGTSPGKYIEMRKVKKSLELLREPLQVKDIAAEMGFWNYETYSRVFKKYCRISPSELQFMVHVIEDNTEPDAPAVISLSRNPTHLRALVVEAMTNEVFSPQSLDKLKVCIIEPNRNVKGLRKVEEKYSFSFEDEMIPEILTGIDK